MNIQHKFRNVPTEIDGVSFQSKKEARYFEELRLAQKAGELLFFLRQAPFHLPGGVIYRVDFVEFWKDGNVRFVDVKGFKTPMYEVKRKLVESLYPIKILEA